MIDSFKVKADIPTNKLFIQLRGYFMKSELELAFYLSKRESKKLRNGFEVIVDLDGMHTDKSVNQSVQSNAKRIFTTLGAGRIRFVGAIPQMQPVRLTEMEYFGFENVGFYPN